MSGDHTLRIHPPMCAQNYSNMYSDSLLMQNLYDDVGMDFDSSCFNFGGSSMGNMWGMGNQDPMTYMRMQSDMEDYQIEREAERRKKMAKIEIEESSNEAAVEGQIKRLQKQIDGNNFDSITGENGTYNELISAEREKLKNILGYTPSDKDTIQAAKDDFAAASGGLGVSDCVDGKKRPPIVDGFFKNFFCWDRLFGSKKSARDLSAELDGVNVSKEEKGWETVGKVLGAAATGLLIFAGIKHFGGGLHFVKQTRMTSKMNKVEDAYASAKAMRKADKSSISKADVNTIKSKRKAYKSLIAKKEAAYQKAKAFKLTKSV